MASFEESGSAEMAEAESVETVESVPQPEEGEPPVKRARAESPAPDEPAPEAHVPAAEPTGEPTGEPMATGDAAPAAEALPPPVVPPAAAPLSSAPPNAAAEEASLQGEIAWLRQQNGSLQQQLASLQQQHMTLTAQAQAAAAAKAAAVPAPAPAPAVRHNQAWTEQMNPENGQTYFWNSQTGESTYSRPGDFNPGAANATSSANANLPQTKGPPGANLFVVRKMRRGEYDEFNDTDLAREFGKYGTVTRAEMTIDKENGWSKGFGFVSFSGIHEADAAMAAVHGSWMAGREMKVEKTHDN